MADDDDVWVECILSDFDDVAMLEDRLDELPGCLLQVPNAFWHPKLQYAELRPHHPYLTTSVYGNKWIVQYLLRATIAIRATFAGIALATTT